MRPTRRTPRSPARYLYQNAETEDNAPMPFYRVPLHPRLVELFAKQAPVLPDVALDRGLLHLDVARAYQAARAGSAEAEELVRHCRTMLDGFFMDGFVIIEAAPLLSLGAELSTRAATALLTWLATPLKAFDDRPLWYPLDIAPASEQADVADSGYTPFHIDLAHTTCPPDYSALWCLRPDPSGGGHTLVSQIRRAVVRLDDEERRFLAARVFRDGDFSMRTGVGAEYRPFSVLDGLENAKGFVRFTEAMLNDMDPRDPHTRAARALERELLTGQRRFRLDCGDLIVINQHVCAHGRDRFGPRHPTTPQDEKQVQWQMLLRARRGTA
ncbi:TauD/TfdA family dioxygenase [Streptomyces sp. PmtG]